MIAYIGYLSLEGRFSAASAPQYVSAVSRYHINHGFASPTLTPTVRDLLQAYTNKADRTGSEHLIRVGCGAEIMKKVLDFGLHSTDLENVWACSMTIFSFIFQCRAATVAHLGMDEVTIIAGDISAKLKHHKGKYLRRPLILSYPSNPSWDAGTRPPSLLQRWISIRPESPGFFSLRDGQRLGIARLSDAIKRTLHLVSATPPPGVLIWFTQRPVWRCERTFEPAVYASLDHAAPRLGLGRHVLGLCR